MEDDIAGNHPPSKKGLIGRLRAGRAPQIRGFDRILISVDFSPVSKPAVALAQSLTNEAGVLYFIHVTPDLVGASSEYLKEGAVKELQKQIAQTALKKLTDWVAKCVCGNAKIEYVVGAGDPASEIIKAARAKQVQAIVMGVHGQNRSDLGLLGSTADKVIRISDCPVICVPPRRI